MSKNQYDAKKEATRLAKVLKYNPELATDPERFADCTTALEVSLTEAYNAGKAGKTAVENLYEDYDFDVESLPPPAPTGVVN